MKQNYTYNIGMVILDPQNIQVVPETIFPDKKYFHLQEVGLLKFSHSPLLHSTP